jgi:hypothetical protein
MTASWEPLRSQEFSFSPWQCRWIRTSMVYMNVCVCTYTRILVCARVHSCTMDEHLHVYVYVYIWLFMVVCICMHACVCVNLSIRMCVNMYMRISLKILGSTYKHILQDAYIHILFLCICVPRTSFQWCASWCTTRSRFTTLTLSVRPSSTLVTMHCAHAGGSSFTKLTLCVPEQVSARKPDHDAACERVPGPYVTSMAVSSGMWLMVVLYVRMGKIMCVLWLWTGSCWVRKSLAFSLDTAFESLHAHPKWIYPTRNLCLIQ